MLPPSVPTSRCSPDASRQQVEIRLQSDVTRRAGGAGSNPDEGESTNTGSTGYGAI